MIYMCAHIMYDMNRNMFQSMCQMIAKRNSLHRDPHKSLHKNDSNGHDNQNYMNNCMRKNYFLHFLWLWCHNRLYM